jgi:glycosyltransferase involved in cell wall biosynthesis
MHQRKGIAQMYRPTVSVIVPGHNASSTLGACLSSLRNQDWPGDCHELVYVDDGSTDESREIAALFADRIVRLTGFPRGPATARNLGVEKSSGEFVVFIDADVVVLPHTVSALLKPLTDDCSLDAVFGSYDREPAQPEFISQYRNLFHHYIHQISHEEASTFWAGCGAVRRTSFERLGGFDAALYPTPMIEDIELGHRMRAAGMRIRLEKTIQVKHLKKWTITGIVRADIFYRGIPWMRLLLNERGHTGEIGDLNLRMAAMLSIPLVWSGLLIILLSFWYPVLLPISLLPLGLCVLVNFPTYAFFYRIRGLCFASMTAPLQLLYHLCNGVSVLGGMLCHILLHNHAPGRRARPNTTIQVIECTNRGH